MADLCLPLPPAVADERFGAFAAAVETEVAGIDGDLPRLLIWRVRAIDDPALLTQLAWQFHVMGVEGWDYAAETEQRRTLIESAIELHRYKGTPWAVRTALAGALNLDAAIKEADALRRADGAATGAWAEYQIDPGRTLGRDEAAAVARVAAAWAPARSQLVRLYHDYDLRAARYDMPLDRDCLYDDWSGIDLDGVRQSFRSVYVSRGTAAASQSAVGAVLAYGLRFHRDDLRRWDVTPLDGAAEPPLVKPSIISVQSWRGVRPADPPPSPARWVLPEAALADGVFYDSLNAVFDGWAVQVETGASPGYDGGGGYDAASSWRWLAAEDRQVEARGAATPARAVRTAATLRTAQAVETGVHFSPAAPAQRYDLPDVVNRMAAVGRDAATGVFFARRSAPWGAGAWLDQPWDNAAGGVTMETIQ